MRTNQFVVLACFLPAYLKSAVHGQKSEEIFDNFCNRVRRLKHGRQPIYRTRHGLVGPDLVGGVFQGGILLQQAGACRFYLLSAADVFMRSVPQSAFRNAFVWPVVRRALVMSLVVGSILVTINHGMCMYKMEFGSLCMLNSSVCMWQSILTFLVPYCVSTISSVLAMSDVRKGAKGA